MKHVLIKNPDNDFVLAYADDFAQTATSIEKSTRTYDKTFVPMNHTMKIL